MTEPERTPKAYARKAFRRTLNEGNAITIDVRGVDWVTVRLTDRDKPGKNGTLAFELDIPIDKHPAD